MSLLVTDKSTEQDKESGDSNFGSQLCKEIQVIFTISPKFCLIF